MLLYSSYTPWVAKMLGNSYQVQHAPWDHEDGGVLDSKYGLRCLRLFLQTAMLEPTRYDVIIFNFGFHDIECSGKWPEEYTTPADYAKNLKTITSMLLSTGAKVGYVLTTPVSWNATLNDRVIQYNSIARDVMEEYPTVATADLYTWVISVCGLPPYFNCNIAEKKQPSLHYTASGNQYLSTRVKDLISHLAQGIDEDLSWARQDSLWVSIKNPVPCKDTSGKVVTVCPDNSTCCNARFSSTGLGCCLLPQAIPCGDGMHYCPAGYECDADCSICKCFCGKMKL